MTTKPSYEELERRVQELEKIKSELEYSKEMLWLYEKAPFGYQSLNENGHFIVVNQTWLDTLGYVREEVIGKSFSDFLHPDGRDHFKENFPRFKSTGEILGVEFEMVKKNGDLILVSFIGKISSDKKGNFQQTHCIFHDITELKRTEEALRKSEGKYRILFEHTGEALFVAQDGRIVFHNPRSTELSGYGAEEFQSRPFIEFIHEDDREMVMDHYKRRVMGEKLPERYSFRIIHKSGCILWVQLNAVLIQWDGKPATLNFISDITERKRAEEALKEKTQLLQNITDNMFDLVSLTDMKGNFTFLGDSYKILKYDLEYLIGKNVLEFIHPEDFREISSAFNNFLFRLDDNQKIEYRYRCADRTYIWLETGGRFIKDGKGQPKEILFSSRDITERKLAEQSLFESENRYKALHNASFGGIAIHDQGIILECNQGLSEMTGYQYSELIGMDGLLLFAERSREAVMNNIRTGYEKPYEAFGLRKNGEEFPIRLEARNVPYKGKQVRTVEIRDITEKKKAEIEREKLQAQLVQAQKMESVGRLAGGVAHDINNKMLIILGYAELIQESLEEYDPNHGFIKEVIEATKQSTDIVRQLLAFARKQIIIPKSCELNEIVESLLKMLRRLIGEDIDLSWEPGPGLWPVKIDPAQIDQILANLCVNARDAIAGVGKITVETENVAIDEDYCSGNAGFLPGEYVMLSFSDNGVGMDKETISKIFEPFFTTKDVGKGTGLGLPMIYGIVKQNKGFIYVDSESGKGATFRLYFPRHAEVTKPIEKYMAEEIPVGSGETVLIVEDEAPVLKLTQSILERFGYNVLEASSPQEAMTRAKEHSGEVHLLITDVVMPEMNGRDLAKKLLTDYPKLKVLYMSGYTANVIASHGVLNAGVHFIQKPFSKRDLAVKVRKTLEK